MARITAGIMASAEPAVAQRLGVQLDQLALEIAGRNLILFTGATTGVPDRIARAARARGTLCLGVSPAHNATEHISRYALPLDACDAIIYTGFGLKGRNVVLVRSCDVVLIVAGGMGTLNEFTTAIDEGKVVGVLRGSGGVADEIERLLPLARNRSNVVIESDPAKLLDQCLEIISRSSGE